MQSIGGATFPDNTFPDHVVSQTAKPTKSIRKRPTNESQNNPKTTPNRSQNDPKSISTPSNTHPKTADILSGKVLSGRVHFPQSSARATFPDNIFPESSYPRSFPNSTQPIRNRPQTYPKSTPNRYQIYPKSAECTSGKMMSGKVGPPNLFSS